VWSEENLEKKWPREILELSMKHASGLILEKQRCRPALAADYWQKLPHDIKDLNLSIFPRKSKQYLLRKQM